MTTPKNTLKEIAERRAAESAEFAEWLRAPTEPRAPIVRTRWCDPEDGRLHLVSADEGERETEIAAIRQAKAEALAEHEAAEAERAGQPRRPV